MTSVMGANGSNLIIRKVVCCRPSILLAKRNRTNNRPVRHHLTSSYFKCDLWLWSNLVERRKIECKADNFRSRSVLQNGVGEDSLALHPEVPSLRPGTNHFPTLLINSANYRMRRTKRGNKSLEDFSQAHHLMIENRHKSHLEKCLTAAASGRRSRRRCWSPRRRSHWAEAISPPTESW